jgi:hypothetical protein
VIRTSGHIPSALSLALAAAVVSGCSGSAPSLIIPSPSAPVGLPAPPTAGPANTYFGVQSPGMWTLTLDNTSSTFSYQPVTYPASPNAPASEAIQITHGFTALTSNGSPAGLALEVTGRFAILRPGGLNTPLSLRSLKQLVIRSLAALAFNTWAFLPTLMQARRWVTEAW